MVKGVLVMQKRRSLFLGLFVLAFAALAPAVALAQSQRTAQATLSPLNDSGASGVAVVTIEGDQATVEIQSNGLLEGSPHAQHIHGMEQAISECPTLALDSNGDGLIDTPEGQPAYGPILVSLTTEGDTSPDSALAVDRFPVGNESYSRTFTIDSSVAEHIEDFAIVQHGVDLDGSGQYDGDAKSTLDPSLPLEATIPANCGALALTPVGGVQGGGGGTAATPGSATLAGMFALGGVALVGALVLRRRLVS